MTMKVTVGQLRSLIREAQEQVNEDAPPPAASAAALGSDRPLAPKKPPVPGQKGPNLKGFKADCNMMADAASRVKQILDAGQGNTKEALRWLDKTIQFAQSAKKNLGQG